MRASPARSSARDERRRGRRRPRPAPCLRGSPPCRGPGRPSTKVSLLEPLEAVVEERGGVGEGLVAARRGRSRPGAARRASATRRGRSPRRPSYPVLVPNAPGYSHSSALRFWICRGRGPRGAGIVRNRVAVIVANPGASSATRTRRSEVAWRSSGRGRPARSARRTRCRRMPSCRARAFIEPDERRLAIPATCDRERDRGVVRGAEQQRVEQVVDGDALPRPQPEGRGRPEVVVARRRASGSTVHDVVQRGALQRRAAPS